MRLRLLILLGLFPLLAASQFNLHEYFDETSIVHEGTIWGNGACFFDFNKDGLDDITTPDGNQLIRTFSSVGDSFVEVNLGIELPISAHVKSILWVDYDNDEDFDLFVAQSGGQLLMFEQTSTLVFQNVSLEVGFPEGIFNYQGAAFADVDHDSDLDFYVAKYYTPNLNPGEEFASQFYINNGDKTFTEVASQRGLYLAPRAVFQPVFVDVNNDSHLDLFVIVDRASWANELYLNDGNGFFVSAPPNAGYLEGIDSMSATVGDYNNDGDVDFFVSDGYSGNLLLDNSGSGFFTNLAANLGVVTYGFCWGANWLDANNDGLLDLTIATTTSVSGVAQNIFYKQNEDGTFSNASADWGLSEDVRPSHVNVIGDFNNDGYTDYFNNNAAPYPSNFWKNDGGTSNFIKISLEGTSDNYAAIGSIIQVYANNQIQTRFVLCGESYLGQNSNTKIFGLGQTEFIDSLLITWPNGSIEKFYNFLATGSMHIVQGESLDNSSNFALEVFDTTICPGQHIPLTINAPVESILWSNGFEGNTLIVNSTGTYSALISVASGFTFLSDTIQIEEQSPPEISYFLEDPTCFNDSNGSISLDVNYEENVVFSIDEIGETSSAFNGLQAGAYEIFANSQSGCSASIEVELTNPNPIQASVLALPELCAELNYGGVEITNITGGTEPYSIIFSAENQDQLPIGNNQCVIIDQNGCFSQFEFEIEEAQPINWTTTVTHAIDEVAGSILVSAAGGTGILELFINDVPNLLEQPITFSPGEFTVEIVDENDCTVSETVTIEQHTRVNENEIDWIIYPNPFDNELILQCMVLTENNTVFVYNALGELIKAETIFNLNHTIDTQNWVPGVYFLKLGSYTTEVIKL
jgi:hypothetical protein